MRVKNVMTARPVCCSPEATLVDVARKMADFNCGEIPVVDNEKLVGVITDRDIVVRALAEVRNPLTVKAIDIMTIDPVTIEPEADLSAAIHVMEQQHVRRLPVVGPAGEVLGIVSLTDLVHYTSRYTAGEILREVSRPNVRQPRPVVEAH